jgi:hypothetical protein
MYVHDTILRNTRTGNFMHKKFILFSGILNKNMYSLQGFIKSTERIVQAAELDNLKDKKT